MYTLNSVHNKYDSAGHKHNSACNKYEPAGHKHNSACNTARTMEKLLKEKEKELLTN